MTDALNLEHARLDVALARHEALTHRVPLVLARCCQDWPVFTLAPIGRCGKCGQRPKVIGEWVDR